MPHVDPVSPQERAGRHPDAVIASLAGPQAGVVARRQLTAAGLTRHQVDERVRSGHLHALHRGVYAVGHLALNARSGRFAAWLSVGLDAAVSRRSAAAEHDLRSDGRAVVDVSAARHVRARRGVRVHEANLAPGDVVVVAGLRVTSVARTLLDLAAERPQREVARAIERAEKLRVLDWATLDAILVRAAGHHGTGALRRAMAAYDPRHEDVRGDLERDVLPMLDALGLPRPQVNAPLGPYVADLLWPVERIVVELDSWQHHRDRAAFEADRACDRWCALRGFERLRFTWRQVRAGALAALGPVLERRRLRAG